MDKWLWRRTKKYFTLNFPCGKSQVGDVRADIDPAMNPDVVADVLHPPFVPGSFEFVICDPPYSIFNRFKWMLHVKDLCTKYFLISTPKLCPIMRGFSRVIFATFARDKLFLRPWILYTKKNLNLPDFFEGVNAKDTWAHALRL